MSCSNSPPQDRERNATFRTRLALLDRKSFVRGTSVFRSKKARCE